MHGCSRQKGGDVFAEAEEADAPSKVRRLGACTHTRPIARVTGANSHPSMSPTMSTVTSKWRRRNCATASSRRSTPFGGMI